MNQNIWGPKYWFTLHTMTFEFPQNPTYNDRKTYYNLFTSLQHVLPCSICRKNYKKNLRELPLEHNLYSRKAIVYWLIDIHNRVNAETGKRNYSYDEVINMYSKILNKPIKLFDAPHSKYNPNIKTGKIYINVLIILFALLLLAIIIKKIIYSKRHSS